MEGKRCFCWLTPGVHLGEYGARSAILFSGFPGGAGGGEAESESQGLATEPLFSRLLLMLMFIRAKIKSSYPPRHLPHPNATVDGTRDPLGARNTASMPIRILSTPIHENYTVVDNPIPSPGFFILDSHPNANAIQAIPPDFTMGENGKRAKYINLQHLDLSPTPSLTPSLLRIGGALLGLCLFPQLLQLVLPLLGRGVNDILLDTENAGLDNS